MENSLVIPNVADRVARVLQQRLERKSDIVVEYYNDLKGSEDLITDICCPVGAKPLYIQHLENAILHSDFQKLGYGCGNPIPPDLKKGQTILDQGSGWGGNVFKSAWLVGPQGQAYGIDKTKKHVDFAIDKEEWHKTQFNYPNKNTQFLFADIADMDELFPDNSLDWIISDCVGNLIDDDKKQKVMDVTYAKLKKGGTFYTADVLSEDWLPDNVREDKTLVGECIGRTVPIEHYRKMAINAGFHAPRVVSQMQYPVDDQFNERIGDIPLHSMTWRLSKVDKAHIVNGEMITLGVEGKCYHWDDGLFATYKKPLHGHEKEFWLDHDHLFPLGEEQLVCGDTAMLIQLTPLGDHFDFRGSVNKKGELFTDCGTEAYRNSGRVNLSCGDGNCC